MALVSPGTGAVQQAGLLAILLITEDFPVLGYPIQAATHFFEFSFNLESKCLSSKQPTQAVGSVKPVAAFAYLTEFFATALGHLKTKVGIPKC